MLLQCLTPALGRGGPYHLFQDRFGRVPSVRGLEASAVSAGDLVQLRLATCSDCLRAQLVSSHGGQGAEYLTQNRSYEGSSALPIWEAARRYGGASRCLAPRMSCFKAETLDNDSRRATVLRVLHHPSRPPCVETHLRQVQGR